MVTKTKTMVCQTCNGTGKVTQYPENVALPKDCPDCAQGQGETPVDDNANRYQN